MPEKDAIGKLLSLVVHDLRNPTATVSANFAFIRDVLDENGTKLGDDVQEAMDDAGTALAELMRGLDQCAWIARWLTGDSAIPVGESDVVAELESARLRHRGSTMRLELPDAERRLMARGGSALAKLLDTLIANSIQHAGHAPIILRASRTSDRIVVEVVDEGRAIAPALRAEAFTLAGQMQIKGRSDGRYGRVAGLFAAGTLAEAIGAQLEAQGSDGEAVFRLALQPA